MRTSKGCWGHVAGGNLVVAAVQAVVVVDVHVHLQENIGLRSLDLCWGGKRVEREETMERGILL